MSRDHHFDSAQILETLFQRLGKGYISLKAIPAKLTSKERAVLQIKAKKAYTQKEVLSALGSVSPPYRLLKKGGSDFLVDKGPLDLVYERVIQKPGKTIGQIADRRFPLKIDAVIDQVNHLIRQGVVTPIIRPTQKIELHLKPSRTAGKQTMPADTAPPDAHGMDDAIKAFQAAYHDVGQGRHFVEIYKIRRRLQWSRERFDETLSQLMSCGSIAANLGNPGDLTQAEVVDSYQDEYGDLYITVTWR